MLKQQKNTGVVAYLESSTDEILDYLKEVFRSKKFDYRTFGTTIEEHLTDAIVKVLEKGGFIKDKKDYSIAPSKNDFPDFILKTTPNLALEFKTGNRSQYRNGKWVTVSNSENDMGTLNEWPNKIKRFGGENIYYAFVIYNFNDHDKQVLSVKIGPFYRFIGINNAGVLKYREKDGNLRPKDFDVKSPVKTLGEFERLFKKTVIYRSKRIIKKHKLLIKRVSQDS